MDSGSPCQWLRELRLESQGLNPISLLIDCAKCVASGSIKNADIGLEYISQISSPDGNAVQRMVSYFSEALGHRIIKHLPGVYKSISPSKTSLSSDDILAEKYFYELCPFLKFSYLITNQAIVEAMECEMVVHIIDLHCCEPAQWIDLLLTFKNRRGRPPHLKITGINESKEVLDQVNFHVTSEAGKYDFPLQFYPIVSKLEDVDFEKLPVKTGDAVAITSVLQLHLLLSTDDDVAGRISPAVAASMNLQRTVHMGQRTFAEWLERDMINAYILSPDSALSPLSFGASPKMGNLLKAMRKLNPKLVVVTEQESNLNGSNLMERVDRALYFYSALFDCLDSTVMRTSVERQKLERTLFGEQIKNIIACEGVERKERHEKLEKWIRRLEMAGFVKVPLSYNGRIEAKNLLQRYSSKYKFREENDCLFVCWSDRPLFSVSAWSFRR
ncbi:scarecrow-like protein 3 [Vigna radiata var. radiata]|uniref:Scarecrow-like protein 3 n=1 Tax=Vigna radiata var. radiata TaxID=3916 RepID=A0A1S3U0B5_VIGRR|nr:scarecrow-like protein 3 [Vigna radiata var. radiata]